MDRAAWTTWWRTRGEGQLALLLWAVWNPIGPVPPDEYADYVGPVAAILVKAREADAPLAARADDEAAQVERNALWADSVDTLMSHLARMRESMIGEPPDAEAEKRAAEVLLDWYEWEMSRLEPELG